MAKNTKPKNKGSKYDKEAIGRVYRAGNLSDREIAKQFGCSHTLVQQFAKEGSWKKDLSHRVKQEVANKLLARVAKSNTDDEIVDRASEINVILLETHRKDIAALKKLEQQLIEELYNKPTKLYLTQYQGEIIQKEVMLTAAERAQAANNLANVQHKRIQLERQAFNIGDGDTGKDTEIAIYAKIPAGKRAALNVAYMEALKGDE